MLKRLIFALPSTIAVVVLCVFALKGVVVYERGAVLTTQQLLGAGAVRIEIDLKRRALAAPALAARFVESEGLPQDLRAMANAVTLASASGRAQERLRQRIDSARGQLLKHITVFRRNTPEVTAVTIVDDTGIVLVTSGSSSFEVADTLIGDPETASPSGGEGRDTSTGALLFAALNGQHGRSTRISDAGFRFLGAVGVPLRNRIVGAVIIETEATMPRVPGAEAFVLVDGEPALGSAPDGFEPGLLGKAAEPFLLVARRSKAEVPPLGRIAVRPFFLKRVEIGIWARTFEVFGAPASTRGLLFADVTPLYGRLAGFQIAILALSVLVIAIHALAFVLGGQRLRDGVEQMTRTLTEIREGRATTRRISDPRLPPALAALASQIDAVAGHDNGVERLPLSPSLDEVVQAQGVGDFPVPSDLEFQRIADAGSLGLDDSGDGFESLGDVAHAAADELRVEQEDDARREDLPDAPDAIDAIDHLETAGTSAWVVGEEPTDEHAIPEEIADFGEGATLDRLPESPHRAQQEDVLDAAAVDLAVASESASEQGSGDDDGSLPRWQSAKPPPPPYEKTGDQVAKSVYDVTTVVQLSPELFSRADHAEDSGAPSGSGAKKDAAEEGRGRATEDLSPDAAEEVEPDEVAADELIDAADPEQMHFREVFDEFLRTREACGEATSDVAFERFAAKLASSRDAVVAKHDCRTVRFQVYVKNGRAALKAIPTR